MICTAVQPEVMDYQVNLREVEWALLLQIRILRQKMNFVCCSILTYSSENKKVENRNSYMHHRSQKGVTCLVVLG